MHPRCLVGLAPIGGVAALLLDWVPVAVGRAKLGRGIALSAGDAILGITSRS